MSNSPNYTAEYLEREVSNDPILLDAELKELRSAQLNRAPYTPNTSLDEATNASLAADYENLTALLIRRQIAIIATLRRTGTTGPAAKGGKRAKKAGVDLRALEASILGTPVPG